MTKKLLSTLIASLFVAAPAMAQSDDPFRLQGSVSIGPIYTDQNAANTAKLEEYQDLGNGVLSNVYVLGRNRTMWVDGYGENFTRDDQFIFLRGGMYDLFKYNIYSNSIPHHISKPARTPWAGTGNAVLIGQFPNVSINNWDQFTLGYVRIDNGGSFEWQGQSPWYFRVDGNQVKFDGTKVAGGSSSNSSSPGGGYSDIAFPTDYNTANVGVEGGYQTRTATFALRWDYSEFTNGNEVVQWTNPYFGNNLDSSWLPPDNKFNKFTGTANFRDLPWRSVISARYTWAEAKSDASLATSALNGTGATAYQSVYPSEGQFNGKHTTQSFQLSWTANPAQGVDTRAYYFWTKMDNDSDLVEYGHAPTQALPSGLGCGQVPGAAPNTYVPGNCDSELFTYEKQNVGIDAYWRFAKGQRIGAGWDYVDLEQHRFDYNGMSYNKFWVEYKNTMLANLAARLKYTYLDRDSTFNLSNAGVNANDGAYLLRYTSSFDMQALKSDQFKLTVDWSPAPMFDLSFEGIWRKNDYQDVTLGRTNDKRQEYYLTASFAPSDALRITAFGDWEEVKYDSGHRYIGSVASGPTPPPGYCGSTAPANCYNPATPPNSVAYNWNSGTKDTNWAVGVGVDWQATSQLMVKGSYFYFETDGSADFASQNAAGEMVGAPAGFGSPLNIGNFDDTKRQSLNLKAIYAYNKAWSFTLGYAYEKWTYGDIGYDGYQYTIPYPPVTTNISQSYLNGYNAFTNGDQNIFYGYVTFKF